MLREWKSIGKSWIERLNIVSFWRRISRAIAAKATPLASATMLPA